MKKADVEIGAVYMAKVSGVVVPVRIVGVSQFGGWNATSVKTGRAVRIKGVQRLREKVA